MLSHKIYGSYQKVTEIALIFKIDVPQGMLSLS